MKVGYADSIGFNYRSDMWIDVMHKIDMDNNYIELFIDGEFIYAWPFNYQAAKVTGQKQLGAVHFKSNPNHLFYIDDIQLGAPSEVNTGVLHNTIFTVDMGSLINGGGTVADKVYLTGDFNNWDPTGTPLTNTSGNLWNLTLLLSEGDTVNYKFVNGEAEEIVPDPCGISSGENGIARRLIIDTTSTVADVVCFGTCVGNCAVIEDTTSSINSLELEASIKVYPNPTTGKLYMDFDFGERSTIDLRIFNTVGQEVKKMRIISERGEGFPIDLGHLPKGLYLLNFSNAEGGVLRQLTRKVLVE